MLPTIKPKWTLIFLLSAKNNLFFEQLNVIKEIYSVGSTDSVKLVIILDGLSGDKFSDILERPSIFSPRKNSDFLTDTHIYILERTKSTLANKKDLKELLNYIIENFEAENYGFFYKGHGGPGETDLAKGIFDTKLEYIDPKLDDDEIETKFKNSQHGWTLEGYCEYPSIQINKQNKKPVLLVFSKKNTASLSYYGLATVLKDVFKGNIGFCCLDCCWAQQIENAYNFKGVADYFIASADEMPVLGIGYAQLCSQFINRPSISAEEAANLIVAINFNKNYADYDSEIAEFRNMGVSISSINLKEYDTFQKSFTTLCTFLAAKLEKKDKYIYSILDAARGNCSDYTYKDTDNLTIDEIDYPMFNIDLIWLMENLLYYNVNDKLDILIYDIIYQLKNNIITSCLSSNYKRSVMGNRGLGGKGISICFPKNRLFARRSILFSKEMEFYKVTGWKDVLVNYYSYKNGKKNSRQRQKSSPELEIVSKFLPPADQKVSTMPGDNERLVFVSTTKKDVLKKKQEKRAKALS